MSDISSGKLSKQDKLKDVEDHSSFSTETDLLKKKMRNKHKFGLRKSNNSIPARGRKPVKFGAEFSSDSDTEDDDDERKGKLDMGRNNKEMSIASTPTLPVKNPSFADLSLQPARPPARTVSSSTATLVDRGGGGRGGGRHDVLVATLDYEKEIEAVKDKLRRNGADGIGSKEEVEYSDYEEDVTKGQARRASVEDPGEPWSPGFFKRHQSQGAQSQGHVLVPPRADDILSGIMPVPATPSLIKAIDRITLAQRDAFGVQDANSPRTTSKEQPIRLNLEPPSQPGDVDVVVAEKPTPRWEEFWREVRTKARS